MIFLKVCSKIMDPVTTTDELIPSGETSSYRSNPLGLAEFTLSRRDPEYVGRSKRVDAVEKRRVAETYDYATSGIDYSKGTSHHVEGSHYVKCTDEEFAKWCK